MTSYNSNKHRERIVQLFFDSLVEKKKLDYIIHFDGESYFLYELKDSDTIWKIYLGDWNDCKMEAEQRYYHFKCGY